MALINNLIGLIIVYLLFVLSCVSSEDICVQRTPCMCVFPNGTGIDLTPSAGVTFYPAPVNVHKNKVLEIITYYYHPCTDMLSMNQTTTAGDSCNVPLSLYRVVTTLQEDTTKNYTNNGTICNYLGKSEEIIFANDSKSITYKNGPSGSKVLLSCVNGNDAADNQLSVTSLADPQVILLTFYSSHACLKQIEEPYNGRSFGSTLLIILFSFVVFYIVLGVCTKKFLMGATGIEVIPNLAFWTDLPNLVKDGWAFAIGGFKLPSRGLGATAAADPNSYDSI